MILPSCDISTDVTGKVFLCKSHETMALMESSGDGQKQHGKPLCEASLPNPETAPLRRSSDFDWQEEFKSLRIAEESTETTDDFEDVKLDNDHNCSDIEIVKKEIFYIYRQARKRRSYKKKLKDAISSILRHTKKPDYEQLAIWYADAETKRRAGGSSTSSMDSCSTRHSTHDSSISDWELL